MRDLTATRNVLEVQDGISGDVHELYYRAPTNTEQASYQTKLFSLKGGKKMKVQIHQTRAAFGKKILTGFKKGTFGIDGKAFSSDPADPDYRGDWKELLSEHASAVLNALCFQVFEGTGVYAGGGFEIDSEEEGEEEEGAGPLE